MHQSHQTNPTSHAMIPHFVPPKSVTWTPRAKTSVTPWTTAQSVATYCKQLFPEAKFIIDTTACYGNETLAFRLEYDDDDVKVEACEWDLAHMVQLRKIIRQSPAKPIALTSKSSVKRLSELPADVLKETIVVCDPCWGGPNYKKQSVISTLKLADQDVKDLVIAIPARLWVLKVPANYDTEHLLSELKASGQDIQPYQHASHRPNGSVGMIHIFLKRD